MKYPVVNVLFLFFSLAAWANPKVDSLLNVLDRTIAGSHVYEQGKIQRINLIKEGLSRKAITDEERYRIYDLLYQEYEAYISDSARHYINRNIDIASAIQNDTWLNEAKIKKANLLSTAGLYSEAIELLQSIDKRSLTSQGLIDYYLAFEHNYLYQSEYVSGDELMNKYMTLMYIYRDSALMVLPQDSYQYVITKAPQLIDTQNVDEAAQLLISYLPQVKQGTRNYSILTSILAFVYQCNYNEELRKIYLIESAISDIQAVVKENNSLRSLAELLYGEGQISRADLYVKVSLEDANFYNARLRNIQASKMLPIIDSAYQHEKAIQSKKLHILLIIISILSFFLMIAVVYVVVQMKRLARTRKEVLAINTELQKLNSELREANIQQQQTNNILIEANSIKEEYIGRFLGLCSAYIEKLETYRRMLNKMAASGKVDELYKTLKSNQFIDNELKEFYQNFDTSFLNIFPNFVENFNKLLPEEERIFPKQDEHLTTELRIFALIRLGINDSSKIASFLRYSITTIYTYRSKLKNKSLYKDNFEDKLMEIR